MLVDPTISPTLRSSIAGCRKGASRTGSFFTHIRMRKTTTEPNPRPSITCPTGIDWLAILISRSTMVKDPIAAIIRRMLRRLVFTGMSVKDLGWFIGALRLTDGMTERDVQPTRRLHFVS